MILTALALSSTAMAGSYSGTTLARTGSSTGLYYAVMSPNGNVCFTTYGTSGSELLYWSKGDTSTTTVTSGSNVVYCIAITNSAYAVAYGYNTDGSELNGFRYDGLTGDLTALDGPGNYVYAYYLNENGYAAGYASDSTTGETSPVWWGPEDSEANVIADYSSQYAYALGITESNEILLSMYSYFRGTYNYSYSLYDVESDVSTDLPDLFEGTSYVQLAEDDTVVEYNYTDGIVTSYDPVYGSLDAVFDEEGTYGSVVGSNLAGELLLYTTDSSGLYSPACWSRARGMVDLDHSGSYALAQSINDVGMVVGYEVTSGRFARTRPMLWDCATGVGEELPLPMGGTSGYALRVTERGQVLLYNNTDRGYYLYDLSDGTYARLGTGGRAAALYGFSDETGDALLLEYDSTGRRQTLSYYTYSG